MRSSLQSVLLWVAAAAYLLSGANIGLIYLDDGAAAFGAWNVVSGQVPYRDFMIIGGPAYFYLLAALFKLIGPSLIVERFLSVAVLAGICVLVYQVTLKITPKRWALIAFVLALSILASYPHYPGGQPLAVFFSLASTLLFFRGSKNKGDSVAIFFCGVLTAFSVLFRQDVGAVTSVVQVLCLMVASPARLKMFFLGLGIPLLAAAGYFFLQVPFDRLSFAFWGYPAGVYSRYAARAMPIGEAMLSDKLIFLMPFIVYPAAFLIWFKKRSEKEALALLYLLIFGLLNLNQARLRSDAWHFLATWMPASILGAVLSCRIWIGSRSVINKTLLVAAGGLILAGPLMLKAAIGLDGGMVSSGLERAKGILFLSESYGTEVRPAEFLNYEKAVHFIQDHTKPGEKIFVGSSRHDRICSADPLFYFLADRPSAVYDYEMHRGYFNTPQAQEQAIAEITKNKVRYVVRREILDAQCTESNDSPKSNGPSLLDEFFRSRYKPVASFGSEHIYEIA